MTAGQDELDLGDGQPRKRALAIRASRSEHLWAALSAAFRAVGLETTSGGDEVFKQLILARIIEPTSKARHDPGPRRDRNHTSQSPDLERRLQLYAKAGDQIVTAEDPLPVDVTDLLDRIHQRR